MTTIRLHDDDWDCIGYPGPVVGTDHFLRHNTGWIDHPEPMDYLKKDLPKWRDQQTYLTGPYGEQMTYAITWRGYGIGRRPARSYHPMGVVPLSAYPREVAGLQAYDWDGGPHSFLGGTLENMQRVHMPAHLRIFRLRDSLQIAVYTHWRGKPVVDPQGGSPVVPLARMFEKAFVGSGASR